MTLDFIALCRDRPDADKLAGMLEAVDWGVSNGRRCLSLGPEKGNMSIYIYLDPSYEIYELENSGLSKMVCEARKNGYVIPREFLAKLKRDGRLHAALLEAEDGIHYDGRCPAVFPDAEMYRILAKYPHLPAALPVLSKEFELARFSEGAKLHKVRFETFISAPVERVSRMASLAVYVAKANNGILYDPQTNTFGTPQVEKIVESATRFFNDTHTALTIDDGRVLRKLFGTDAQ